MTEDQQGYADFLLNTDFAWCWWCGRMYDSPANWHAPWLIERAHIVSALRLKDRRVAALLCSLCHRKSHGQEIPLVDCNLPAPTLGNMLWLKRTFDSDYYDLKILRRYHDQKLPRVTAPSIQVMEAYVKRQGGYPKKMTVSI